MSNEKRERCREEIRLAEERLAEERLAEERLANERLVNERLANERLVNERLANERFAEERLVNERIGQENESSNSNYCRKQHVHEIIGSTLIAERCKDPHNHRFATVSDEAIPFKNSHVHNVKFRTDSYEGHYHEFCGKTSVAIPVGDGKHVHFIKARTKAADGHTHEFKVATLIDSPIED